MATTTRMMYTLLPNGGAAATGYKLSIFLSPRLEGTGPTGLLLDYTLGNWAQSLRTIFSADDRLRIELGSAGGPQVLARVTAASVAGLDAALWADVFPPALTRVTARVFKDHSKRWFRSFPVRPLETYIQGLYNTVANAYPASFPDLKGQTPVTPLLDAIARAKPLIDHALPPFRDPTRPREYPPVPQRGRATHPDGQLEQELTALAGGFGSPPIPLAAMFQAIRFYKRGNQPPYQSADVPYDPNLVPNRPPAPTFDFHQALGALGDHPFLLRKLGLILDLTLDPAASGLLGQFTQMQLFAAPAVAGIGAITPWTSYQINAVSGFRPTPFPAGDLQHGLARLDNGNFDVIQTDPDGNVIKVFDHAVSMEHYRGILLAQKAANPQAKTSQAPEETSLPALRSGGITVTRAARDDKLWDTTARQALLESNPEAAVLAYDDVLRGWRFDVFYRGNWHSLCRRRGTYEVVGSVIDQPGPDEGYLKAESASSDPVDIPPNQQQPDLYVHESVVVWRNYSLVASVPGKTIVPTPLAQKHQREDVLLQRNEPGAGFDVAVNFVAEKLSLPPLRYGETYRLRARAVDLAGNSWTPPPSRLFPMPGGEQAPSGIGVSGPIRYFRFDPVPAPMLLVTAAFREGESMETLVVRSRGDVMPAPLPPPLMIDETAMFNQTNVRWMAAPKTYVGQAEAHGMFDSLFNQPADTSRDILARESGAFDDLSIATIVDRQGQVVPPASLPADWDPGDPLPNDWYFINTTDPLLLPYLPDPLAHGVAFMPKDGTGAVLHRPFVTTGWPDARPFKLVLRPGVMQSIALGGPNAEILLLKGTMLTVNYASAVVPPGGVGGMLPEGELDLMGRWHGMTPGAVGGQHNTALHGYQNWMMTPFRTLKLVHAVERPVTVPVITALGQGRSYDETFVVFRNGSVTLHAPSTGEIELRARYQDWVDDPANPDVDPHAVNKDTHVLDRKVDYAENPTLIPPSPPTPMEPSERVKHEFGDTKHRWVYYRAVGTTRYREYFPPSITDYQNLTPDLAHPGIIKKETLISVDGPEFLELVGGSPTPLDVKSSARPLPPEPLYVIPTFKWQDTPSGRQRLGRGLRIYVARGWFSSGVDELLGVVLLPPNFNGNVDDYRPYVTQWGSDPLFNRVGPSDYVAPSHFVSDPTYPETAPHPPAQNLFLAETQGGLNLAVQVLGFDPIFDLERRLWYVDLELQPTNLYYTFIRFGLCRYQPHSLPNVELSRVVRTEFAQLVADRTATLTYTAVDIQIAVFGPSALSDLGIQLGQASFSASSSDVVQSTDPNAPVSVAVPPGLSPNPPAGAAHKVMARLEWRPLGMQGELGWQAVDPGVRLGPYTESFSFTGIVYFMGSVRWPRLDLPQNRQYRLALLEFEVWETDDSVSEYVSSGHDVRDRLVYVDYYPLT